MSTPDYDDIKQDVLGPKPRQGSLLLQFALIGSGRVPIAPPDMQQAAMAIVEEVIDAARRSGGPGIAAPTPTLSLSAPAITSVFEWLEAICEAAGFETVEEIFHRPKPTHLQ